MSTYTIVEEYPDNMNYHCGYCKNDKACSTGVWAHAMNAEDYQALIDRGWRRSGKYCYKPMMDQTCCPTYTIRCEILKYKLTKSRKKVIKKMKNFLMTDDDSDVLKWKARNREGEIAEANPSPNEVSLISDEPMHCDSLVSPSTEFVTVNTNTQKKEICKGLGPDPAKPQCKKAKVLRRERRMMKKTAVESGDAPSTSSGISLESPILQLPHLCSSDSKKKLEVRTIKACKTDTEFLKYKNESFAVYKKYQTTIHGDSPSDCTEKQWIRFLVDCPINRDQDGPGSGYGNYHQHYVLDGKIIAVGVIDILPDCISSVYLYYDPDYGFLSLGVYAALSEIAFSQTLHLESAQLMYYYMGFYIHSCQKMRYKKEYPPSYLLCPETYEWVPVESCLRALSENKYCRLNIYNGGSSTSVDAEKGTSPDSDVKKVRVLYQNTIMNYPEYAGHKYKEIYGQSDASNASTGSSFRSKVMNDEITDLVDYIAAVGVTCASRMLLYRDD